MGLLLCCCCAVDLFLPSLMKTPDIVCTDFTDFTDFTDYSDSGNTHQPQQQKINLIGNLSDAFPQGAGCCKLQPKSMSSVTVLLYYYDYGQYHQIIVMSSLICPIVCNVI